MKKFVPRDIPNRDLHQLLLGSVAPRPIAFVSTQSSSGENNIAPYSFFNVFSSNPPLAIFSSNRRVTNGTEKDTLVNIKETKECVINMVNYKIAHQMSIASVEFDSSINEFDKAGLTPIASEVVSPPRVKESPVHLECKVIDIQTMGDHKGGANLIFCEIILIHINEEVIDERSRIIPEKIDLMGRMGRSYYVRANGENIKTIFQPILKPVIGFDQIPDHILMSDLLSGRELSALAGLNELPIKEEHMELLDKTKSLDKDHIIHKIKEYILAGNKTQAMALALWANAFRI